MFSVAVMFKSILGVHHHNISKVNKDILVYNFLWLLQNSSISFHPVSTHILLSEGRYFNCAERTLNLSIRPLPLLPETFPLLVE